MNSITQVGVRILGSICALFLTWLIARRSAETLGVYRTIISYFLIGDFIALLGMQTYLVREVSVNPAGVKKLGFHALIFAMMVAFIGIAGMGGLALFSRGYSQTIREGLLIVATSLPATAACLVGVSILVGLGQTTTCSLVQGVETLARTAVGIVFILLGYSVIPVIVGMVVVRFLCPFGYWLKVKPVLTHESLVFDRVFLLNLLRQVPTFVGIALLAMVLRFSAPLALPWILDNAAAGQFAAAYIFVDLVLMVPTALTINLVPVMVRHAKKPGPALVDSCRMAVKVMAMGVMPVSAIFAAVAHPMFASIFPGKASYSVSADVLEVVIWTCCLQSIDQVVAATMLAKDKQHIDLRTLFIGAAGMLVLLLILIPLFGVMGAAYGVLGGLSLLVTTRFILVSRHIASIYPFELVWRPAVASIAAAAAAVLGARFHWLIGIAAGGIAYIGALGVLGALTRAERESMLGLLVAGEA